MWGAGGINLIFNHRHTEPRQKKMTKLSPMTLCSLSGEAFVTGCCNLGRLTGIVVISTKPITNNYANAPRIRERNTLLALTSKGNSIKSSVFWAFLTLSNGEDIWETSTPQWPLNLNIHDRTGIGLSFFYYCFRKPYRLLTSIFFLFFLFWMVGINKYALLGNCRCWHIH